MSREVVHLRGVITLPCNFSQTSCYNSMSKLLQEIKESIEEDLQGERYGDAAAVIGVDSNSFKLIFSMGRPVLR